MFYSVCIFTDKGKVAVHDDHVLIDLFDWLFTHHDHPINYELYRMSMDANGATIANKMFEFDSTNVL